MIGNSPQWLEQGSLVNVLGIGDQGQKGGATIIIRYYELHSRPNGNVVKGSDEGIALL